MAKDIQPKNIMLNIVIDMLDYTFSSRFDICKCKQCRADIVAYVLSHVPAKYVTTDVGAITTIMEQARVENEAAVIRKIIDAIQSIGKKPHHRQQNVAKQDKDKAFELLLETIYQERRIDFRRYLPKVLQRRIAKRMSANNVKTYADYLRVLKTDPKEYEELFNVLTINITEFFRDPHIFDVINNIILETIEQKAARGRYSIRVWSAGCSSGEEPYSLAIVLKEITEARGYPFNISIVASDIDKKSLQVAKAAQYRASSLKNINKYLMRKYFEPTEDGNYRVSKDITRLVTFYHHNLISNEPFENMDIVICRNVFIYFNRSLQEHLIMTFHKALKKDGYLIMGAVETFLGEAKILFKEIDMNSRIYQKK
ncbi:MAG: CheR family methyltransferase [bacterium]